MLKTRIIPSLLFDGQGLVKTVQFKNPKYVGDPINAVKIFNDKFVDEIILLDIAASREMRGPRMDLIRQITSECFIPFCYGGGINNIEDARTLFDIGVEKISINTAAVKNPAIIRELSGYFGSQSIVVSMDIKRRKVVGGYTVMCDNGRTRIKLDPVDHAHRAEALGAGELLINSIDCDGVMQGYDLEILKRVSDCVTIPVIACGGAGNLQHMVEAVNLTNVPAVAAGSLFVFKGKHRAVLINYPSPEELGSLFNSRNALVSRSLKND